MAELNDITSMPEIVFVQISSHQVPQVTLNLAV